MQVVFRVDASSTIGSGHVMRCLTLAEALQKKGAAVQFVCREHDGNLCGLIEKREFQVQRLPLQVEASAARRDVNGLGARWRDDAEQTLDAIRLGGSLLDWLIVDHYAIDHRWESRIRPHVKRIMVIDDLANRLHDCDLLLDQNLVANMRTRYEGKVPERCTVLLGPEYAILQPEYAELHPRVRLREGKVRRVLISFGGADPQNLTTKAVSAFLRLQRSDVRVDVVAQRSGPQFDVLRDIAEASDNVHLHADQPTLAYLMAKADLAIGACGTTSWERCCLGLPALVVTLAENQVPIAKELHRRGAVRWLGSADDVDESSLGKALAEILDAPLPRAWSGQCHGMVDGKGVSRIRAVLLANKDMPLYVRRAELQDEALLLAWSNDPLVRANAFCSKVITAREHHRWFRQKLKDRECCRLYIVEVGEGVPIGQVRFELVDGEWKISYSLVSSFRGKGLGASLLRTAIWRFLMDTGQPDVVFFGEVKPENLASSKIFVSLGFSQHKSRNESMVIYRRMYAKSEIPVMWGEN